MTDSTPAPQPAATPALAVWAVRLLALVAVGICLILLLQWRAGGGSLGGTLPGCGPGTGCDTVLSSRWSSVAGVPVAAPALVVYAILLAASLHVRGPGLARARVAGLTLLLTGAMAGGAAIYFLLLQWLAIGAFCRYCTGLHGIGLLLAGLVWLAAPVRLVGPLRASRYVLAGLAAVMAFAAVQLAVPTPTDQVTLVAGELESFDTGPGEDRELTLVGGALRLSPHAYPVLGSPDAPVVIAELLDYTCGHCKLLHADLKQAQQRYGDQLAIVPLVVPLEANCNELVAQTDPVHEGACELASLSLAVYRADADAFEAFHDWLFAGEGTRTPADARAQAQALVGAEALAEALEDPWVATRIRTNVGLFEMMTQVLGGRASLPLLLLPEAVLSGRPPTQADLYGRLEAETRLQFPVPAPGPAPGVDAEDLR